MTICCYFNSLELSRPKRKLLFSVTYLSKLVLLFVDRSWSPLLKNHRTSRTSLQSYKNLIPCDIEMNWPKISWLLSPLRSCSCRFDNVKFYQMFKSLQYEKKSEFSISFKHKKQSQLTQMILWNKGASHIGSECVLIVIQNVYILHILTEKYNLGFSEQTPLLMQQQPKITQGSKVLNKKKLIAWQDILW